MYNCQPLDDPGYQQLCCAVPLHGSMPNPTNKYVYVKPTFTYQSSERETMKVLVNPNFNKKVFVNPNFNGNRCIPPTTSLPKIHVNPNAQNLNLQTDRNEFRNVKKIHVNPNILRNLPVNKTETQENCNIKNNKEELNRTIISTRTKLVRSKEKNIIDNKIRKRRTSIRSQFKVIKSSLLEKPVDRKTAINTKYKLIKSDQNYISCCKNANPLINKFRVDNRHIKTTSPRSKKYIYINRFLSLSDIARNNLLKKNKNKLSMVNIGGVLYKKSPNVLKKTSCQKTNNTKKTQGNVICKSKYKLMRKSLNTSKSHIKLRQSIISRIKINDGKISKLRVCNIPCPYYRKFGRCKGKEIGKCSRKHDPDQIALCTKFLQGACIDKKCLLSHNVSPEKMPTCKFYLEGSCSRDDCPYLHVRISPKADVCRDFLEGFCKKAAECDKRHQLLCPDYEKTGNCLKQRCPYPHGKMVRKYSVFNKDKFAKKSSNNGSTKVKIDCHAIGRKIKSETVNINENIEGIVKSRYYIGQNNLEVQEKDEASHSDQNNAIVDQENDQNCGLKCRPKLGKLPSFIGFENS